MGILSWIIVGGLAGWIASIIMGRNERQGCLMNIVVGVVGAAIGGFIVSLFGGTGDRLQSVEFSRRHRWRCCDLVIPGQPRDKRIADDKYFNY